MLICLNSYWDIVNPIFDRLACGLITQTSELGLIVQSKD